MEKTLRVLGGGEEDSHGHSHSHTQSIETSGKASGVASVPADGLRSRGSEKSTGSADVALSQQGDSAKSENSPSKLSAYLNLFGDFVHNM